MSFQATPAITGIVNFGVHHIDPIEVAKAFQTYLDTGSKLTGVSLDDISTAVSIVPNDPTRVTLVDLLKIGMKLFDAVVWLTAGRPASHPLVANPTMNKDSINSMHEIARSTFYCYFMLLVQARYPVRSTSPDRPTIPNFLRVIMGMDKDQGIYVDNICSFEPSKFNPKWVEYIRFNNFGQESLSRFGLGVAGYRMFGPFKLYRPKPDVDQNLLPAIEFAKKVATAPASWDVHPLTRKPDVLTKRGNLNKNLGNLMLDCFSQGDLEEMARVKIIFKIPEREPTHRQYKEWRSDDDISGNNQVFS
jgi:hypothetical protein